MNIISFPNIGIEGLEISRVAFSIFGRDIYWYGILIMTAIVLAFSFAMLKSKKEGIKSDDIYDLAIWLVIGGIVGARAYYVLTSLEKYDSVWDAFKIWEGGLGFYGCIIGGGIAAIIVTRLKKLSFPAVADMVGPGLLLAQALGRWGNFFNAEAFGSVTEWDFFGRTFDISECVGLPWIMYINGTPVQPTFLYECVWNLMGFALLAFIYNKKKFDGQIFLMYLGWYGSARMLIEGFRTDSLYIGSIRISQLVGLLSMIIGYTLLIVCLSLAKSGKLTKPFQNKNQTEEQNNGKTDKR